jgi:predicted TIM-barrel fold metal-dependent hydrolase
VIRAEVVCRGAPAGGGRQRVLVERRQTIGERTAEEIEGPDGQGKLRLAEVVDAVDLLDGPGVAPPDLFPPPGRLARVASVPGDRFYSCDDHLDLWVLPVDLWQARLPRALRERAPCVVEKDGYHWWSCDGAILGPSGGALLRDYNAVLRAGIEDDGFRASNPRLRLADMDLDGIAASVIYGPSLFGLPIADQTLKAACLAAYNDWAAEFNATDRDRLCVLPVLPTHDVDAAATELERVVSQGHRGAIISPFEFSVGDPSWDRLWAAAEAAGVPVSFHIGHGTSVLKPKYMSWEMAAFSAVGPMQLDEPLAAMIFSGALERHPRLRLVLAESGIGWLPYFVSRMDGAAAKHVAKAADYALQAKPSDLFRRQVFATFEEEPLGPKLIPLLGPDCFMWASDYPHPDSTFPHSRDAVAEAFAGLDADIVRKVTVENCARLYGFPL